MNRRVWRFPRMAPHPAGSGRRGSPFCVCSFWSRSRKRGRLDWHRANIPQPARVAPVQLSPKNHGGAAVPWLTPQSHTKPDPWLGCWGGRGALGVSAGGAGGSLPLPWGCTRGWSSLTSFPGELGGVYGPAYHAAPLIPLIGAGGRVLPCGIRILPAGLQEEEEAQSPLLEPGRCPPVHLPTVLVPQGVATEGVGTLVTQ